MLELKKKAGNLREECVKLYQRLQQKVKSVLAPKGSHSDPNVEEETEVSPTCE